MLTNPFRTAAKKSYLLIPQELAKPKSGLGGTLLFKGIYVDEVSKLSPLCSTHFDDNSTKPKGHNDDIHSLV